MGFTMMGRLRFRFLLEVFYGELRFANHQHAARAQTKNRGSAGDNCQGGCEAEESRLTIISDNRTAHGDQGRGGEQAESGVEKAERPDQQLGADVQWRQLGRPYLVIGSAWLERSQLRGHDAGAIHDAGEAVAGAQREDGGRIRENGGGHDGREYRERIASDRRWILQG